MEEQRQEKEEKTVSLKKQDKILVPLLSILW